MKSLCLKTVVFTALGLLTCMSSASSAEKKLCQLHRAAYLDIFPDSGHRPLVKVLLNGTVEYFLIDTAGIYNAVSEDTAKDLQLEIRKGQTGMTHMSSGKKVTEIAFADHLKIGPLALPRMSLAVMPEGTVAPDVQGLLGGAFLQVFDMELDPAAKKVSFFLHSNCGERVVHWTKGPRATLDFRMNNREASTSWEIVRGGRDWHVVVPAKLDGEDVSATIDTGATTSLIRMGDAKDILSTDDQKNLKRIDDDKDKDPDEGIYTYPFKTLDLDGILVSNPEVVILPGYRTHADKLLDGKPQLILGEDVLSKLHIYIAYGEHKIYLTAADAH